LKLEFWKEIGGKCCCDCEFWAAWRANCLESGALLLTKLLNLSRLPSYRRLPPAFGPSRSFSPAFRLPAAHLLSAAPPCLHFCAWLLNNRVASTPPELPAVHFKLFPSLRFNPGLSSAPLTRVAAALNPLPSPRELWLVQKSPFPTRNSSPGARNACLP